MYIVICIIGLAILVGLIAEYLDLLLFSVLGIATLAGIVALFNGELLVALCCLGPVAGFIYWLTRDPMKKKITLSDPTLEKCSMIRLRMYNNDDSREYYHTYYVASKIKIRDYEDKQEKYQYYIDSSMFDNNSYWKIDESYIELYDEQKIKLPIDWTRYAYSFYYGKESGSGFIDVWPRSRLNKIAA